MSLEIEGRKLDRGLKTRESSTHVLQSPARLPQELHLVLIYSVPNAQHPFLLLKPYIYDSAIITLGQHSAVSCSSVLMPRLRTRMDSDLRILNRACNPSVREHPACHTEKQNPLRSPHSYTRIESIFRAAKSFEFFPGI